MLKFKNALGPKEKSRRKASLIQARVLGPSLHKQSYGWVMLFIIFELKCYFRVIICRFIEELQDITEFSYTQYPLLLTLLCICVTANESLSLT